MAKKLARKSSTAQIRKPKAGSAPAKGGKYVYLFGSEDRRQRRHEAAARRQGRQPRRDVPHRPPGASRASPSPPRSAPTTTPTSGRIRRRSSAQMEAGIAIDREADRQEVRRPEESAARLRPLGRPRLDARHDGHDPQPRPQRRDGRGARRRRPATRASPGTATAASSRCTATSCSACRSAPTKITSRSRRVIDALKHERHHQDIEDTKLTVDDLKELVARFKALVKERAGKDFPDDPVGSAAAARSAPSSDRG